MRQILEMVRRLVIYEFATGKELDGDIKERITHALCFPNDLCFLKVKENEKRACYSLSIFFWGEYKLDTRDIYIP